MGLQRSFHSSKNKNPIASEIKSVISVTITVSVFISLATYSPEDPGFRIWTNHSGLHNWMGRVGAYLSDLLFLCFGGFSFLVAFVPLKRFWKGSGRRTLRSLLLFFSLLIFWQSFFPDLKVIGGKGAGLLGYLLFSGFHFLLGKIGTQVLSIALLLISFLLMTGRSFASLLEPLKKVFNSKKPRTREVVPKVRTSLEPGVVQGALPSLRLLGERTSSTKTSQPESYHSKAALLIQKLRDFGVEGEVVNICQGPVVTVFEFKPANGVKIKEIAGLSDDLTLALSVTSVRIVAPIPGKPVVGIEIPSAHRQTVYFRDLLDEIDVLDSGHKIPLVLGRSVPGEPLVYDLANMPHLLVAGSTGTGKSVFINSLICSLLFRFSYRELKLILVDPKMVELSHYDEIPHLLLPVVVDSKKAALALRWAVEEMEKRYQTLHKEGFRNLETYHQKSKEAKESMPYLVIIIDEYADLMAVVQKDVELSVARLAQKARACGIHLVLATQRPSTDVVTGTIKANFSSRISFRVASSVDSKTILDRTGAERLLGQGDLLFQTAGLLQRIQGAYLSDTEIEKTALFLKSQGRPTYCTQILEEVDTPKIHSTSKDELFETAKQIVVERGEASISLLQRYLHIGYNRAASIMDELERAGVVGAEALPSKRRTITSSL